MAKIKLRYDKNFPVYSNLKKDHAISFQNLNCYNFNRYFDVCITFKNVRKKIKKNFAEAEEKKRGELKM